MKQIVITEEATEALIQDAREDPEHEDRPWLGDITETEDNMRLVEIREDIYNALMQAAIEAPGSSLSEIIQTICAQCERNRDGGQLQ